jgi:hypothetical protein
MDNLLNPKSQSATQHGGPNPKQFLENKFQTHIERLRDFLINYLIIVWLLEFGIWVFIRRMDRA